MPTSEILVCGTINSINTHVIDKGPLAWLNVKEGAEEAANVGTAFDDAIDALDAPEAFNCSFCLGLVGFGEILDFLIFSVSS